MRFPSSVAAALVVLALLALNGQPVGEPLAADWTSHLAYADHPAARLVLAVTDSDYPRIAFVARVFDRPGVAAFVGYVRWFDGRWVADEVAEYAYWYGEEPRFLLDPSGLPRIFFSRHDVNESVLYEAAPVPHSPLPVWRLREIDRGGDIYRFDAARWRGVVGIAYAVQTPGRAELRFHENLAPGNPPVAVGTYGGISDIAMRYDPSGDPHILFVTGLPSPVLYHAVRETGVWNVTRLADLPGTSSALEVRLEIDAAGILHGLEQAGTRLRYGVDNGTGWAFQEIGTDAATSQLALDPAGIPHVLYGQVGASLRLLHLAGGTWVDDLFPAELHEDSEEYSFVLGPDGTGRYARIKELNAEDRQIWYASQAPLPGPAEGVLGVVPDRCSWALGETVRGNLTNVGRGDLWWSAIPADFWVYRNDTGDLVYERIGIAAAVLLLSPGESTGIAWDGTNRTGQPVPAGMYRILSVANTGVPGSWDYTWNESAVGLGVPCGGGGRLVADAGGPYVGYEGTPLLLDASRSHGLDNASLQYRWDFEDDGIPDTTWSSSPTLERTWPDDWNGTVRVEVTDGGGTANATAPVRILNLPPRIVSFGASVGALATLRIAGEKWHDVALYSATDGNETLLLRLVRSPGRPQEGRALVGIDPTRASSLRVASTPGDDPVNGQENGATPACLELAFAEGAPSSARHTFNVRHPETWNWTLDLNPMLAGRRIAFAATATDPGSDDLTFAWDFGDGGSAAATQANPGGVFPFTAVEGAAHAYAVPGQYLVTLRVTDDDGGSVEAAVVVRI